MEKCIIIKNAKHNNLKNISLKIPRNKLNLITGVSGSGKSTLAFDTLYAEGQRRFVESLSSYARQFLEKMTKPDVESITGLLPAVAIEQKSPPRNPRSTVGTITEIYDYIRAFYSRIGKTICSDCGQEIKIDNPVNISETILNSLNSNNPTQNSNPWKIEDKIYIMIDVCADDSPPTINNTPTFISEIERLIKLGFSRVVDTKTNEITELNELKISSQTKPSDYLILVDR